MVLKPCKWDELPYQLVSRISSINIRIKQICTPWKINMEHTNQITHLERKMIFQTSMMMFHVNLPGCNLDFPGTPNFFSLPVGGRALRLRRRLSPSVEDWNIAGIFRGKVCQLPFVALFQSCSLEKKLKKLIVWSNFMWLVSAMVAWFLLFEGIALLWDHSGRQINSSK